MTNEERIKILEMVASGKLTVEQADQLMELFSAKSTSHVEKQPEQGQRASEYTQEIMGRIRGYGKVVDRGLRATGIKWDKQITDLKMYGVSAAYVRALQEAGLGELTMGQITSLKNHGVDTDYIRALVDLDLPDLTVKQIVQLKNYGIETGYIRALREAGLIDLTVEQILALKTYEVSADDVRALQEEGLTDLTVEHILALKKHGG